jgi:hypothetical protein
MSKLIKLFLAVFLITLTACQTPSAPTGDSPTAQIIRIGVTLDTTWIIPNLDACQQDIPGISLSVRETASREYNSAQTILILRERLRPTPSGANWTNSIIYRQLPIPEIHLEETSKFSTVRSAVDQARCGMWLRISGLAANGGDLREVVEQTFFKEQAPTRFAKLVRNPLAVAAIADNNPPLACPVST